MSEASARLALPLIAPAQAQKHVTHNAALARLDLLVQLAVEARGVLVPPSGPLEGQCLILGAVPSGVFAGQGGRIAAFQDGGWVFLTPAAGWRAWDKAAARAIVFDGTAWVEESAGGGGGLTAATLQNLPGVGIGTTSDATNRLAVAAPATLFTHQGAGHQLKLNKAAAGETASLLFQTGFSGRAEIGLAGSDAFALKVSADGSAFATALEANPATARVTLPQGVALGGLAAEPASPQTGWLWHNAATGQVRLRQGGASRSLGVLDTPCIVPPSGEYVMTTIGSGGTTANAAAVAGRIDLFPFTPRADLMCDGWAITVTTAAATAQARLVLYSATPNGLPDQLLLEGGILDCSTTGLKAETIAPRMFWHGQTLWLGIRHSATPSLAMWPATATPDINGGSPNAGARKSLRKTVAFASAAPTTWAWVAGDITATAAPAIWLRMA